MTFDHVKERVREDAKAKADERIALAQAESKRIVSEAAKQLKREEAELRKQLEAESVQVLAQYESAALLDARKRALTARKELVEDVYRDVAKSLDDLPQKDRAAHVKKLLQKAASEIDITVVYCNKADASLISQKTQSADISGGIIAESKGGATRVDYSYETLLDQLRESTLPQLSTLLFSK